MSDVNELAREYAIDHSSEHDMLFPQEVAEDAFTAGYQKAREDLLSKAETHYENYMEDMRDYFYGSETRQSEHARTWQTAKLSSLKEIEKLQSQLTEKEALLKSAVEVIKELQHDFTNLSLLSYENAEKFLAKLKAGEK